MADKNLSVLSKLISYHLYQSWNHQNATCMYYVLHKARPYPFIQILS